MLPCVLFKEHPFILTMYNFIKIILRKIVGSINRENNIFSPIHLMSFPAIMNGF